MYLVLQLLVGKERRLRSRGAMHTDFRKLRGTVSLKQGMVECLRNKFLSFIHCLSATTDGASRFGHGIEKLRYNAFCLFFKKSRAYASLITSSFQVQVKYATTRSAAAATAFSML